MTKELCAVGRGNAPLIQELIHAPSEDIARFSLDPGRLKNGVNKFRVCFGVYEVPVLVAEYVFRFYATCFLHLLHFVKNGLDRRRDRKIPSTPADALFVLCNGNILVTGIGTVLLDLRVNVQGRACFFVFIISKLAIFNYFLE